MKSCVKIMDIDVKNLDLKLVYFFNFYELNHCYLLL